MSATYNGTMTDTMWNYCR